MSVTYAQGFEAAGVAAGISHKPGKKDLTVITTTGPLDIAAAVFTSNRFAAAPVQWSRSALSQTGGHAKAVVINSGGANACTGPEGLRQSQTEAARLSDLLGIPTQEVLVASTGIIGDLLPLDKVTAAIDAAVTQLADTDEAGLAASEAILTTDTRPKRVAFDGTGYRLGGMVKGAGMIAPQLATMICVLTTDAVLTANQAREALAQATALTFDRIDVDGCMSTNDTVLLLASGASGTSPDEAEFHSLVTRACADLARMIVGDGEGSHHEIRVHVTGATTPEAALACARSVAASNLFKCAIAGNDPNWGRILSSIGTVPPTIAPYEADRVNVDINGVRVCEGGAAGQPRDLVDLTGREVLVDIDLGAGEQSGTIWTDDLTHEYVDINSKYES